jgi:competence protein ComEC
LTRKAIWFGVFWLFGIAAALWIGSVYVVYTGVSLTVVAIIVYIFTHNGLKKTAVTAIFAVCALGIGLAYAGSFYEIRVNAVMQYEDQTVTVSGTVTDKTAFRDSAFIIVSGTIENKTPAVISVFADDVMEIGDTVTVTGTLQKPRNVYTFNAESYYKTKQIFLQMPYVKSLEVEFRSGGIRRFAEQYREKLTCIIHEAIPDNDDAALFIAMLFGDRTGISDLQQDTIDRAGISHVMAVSGAQLAIICTIVMLVAGVLGVSKRISFFIMLVPLLLFLLLAEDSMSIRRAAIMVIITYSGVFFSRRSDTANSLAIACIVITAVNPFSLFDASFLLSAGGVFALAVLFPAVSGKHLLTAEEIRAEKRAESTEKEGQTPARILYNVSLKLLSGVKDIVIASAVVSISMLPVFFFYFDSVSVIGILTNIFLIPLSSAVVVLGMVVVLTGGIAFIAYPVLSICGLLCKLSWVITSFFAQFDVGNLPMGYRFETPLLLLLGIAVAVSFILTDNGKRRVVCYLAAVVLFIGTVAVYRVLPSDEMNIAVLGEKRACAVIVHDKFTAAVIDLSGGGDAAASVKRYITRTGITDINAVILTNSANLSLPVYKQTFALTPPETYITKTAAYRLPGIVYYIDGAVFPIHKKAVLTPVSEDFHLDVNGARIDIMSNSGVKAESLPVNNSVTDENLCMVINKIGGISYYTID